MQICTFESDFFPPSTALTLSLAALNAPSTIPAAVLAPLKSSGFFLFAPNILIVGKPRTPYCPPSDLWSSALTAPTLTTPC